MYSRIYNFRHLFILTIVMLLSVGANFVNAQLVPKENNFSLKVGGGIKEIAFTLNDADTSDVECTWSIEASNDFFIAPKLKTGATAGSPISLVAKKASTTPIKLECKKGEAKATITISKIEPATFTITGSAKQPSTLDLIKGQTISLTDIPPGIILSAENNSGNTLVFTKKTDGTYTLAANKSNDSSSPVVLKATIGVEAVSINGADAEKGIPVRIANAAIIDEQPITKNTSRPISDFLKITPPDDFKPTIPLTYNPARPSYVEYDPDLKRLKGLQTSTNENIEIANDANIGNFLLEGKKSFSVKIVPAKVGIQIMSNSGNDVLVGSKTVLNGFIVTDENEKTQMPLQWSVHENDAQFVSVQRVGTEVEVVGLRVPPDNKPISITAKVIGDDAVPAATFTVFVKGRKVITDFKPILVRIDMLDERTAKDLFGGRTEAEYHIAKIRIINNLSADQGGGPASSIFFFSDALEVRVSLQKIVVKPKSNEKKEWLDLSADDIYSINNWKRCEPKDVDKQQANIRNRGLTICSLGAQREIDACNRVPRDDVNRDLKIRDCVAEVKLDEIDCQQRAERAATDCGCNQNDTDCLMQCKFCQRTREAIDNNLPLPTVNGQWIPFRPFIYQVVANTHDRRADRSLRHIAFLGANIAGSGLSFFTSFLVPKPSSDLPLFLDKYQNFAIPTFEKLFPSLREVQRQNIINLVLPPIVEVPYGSDVSKYVFFPKKRIIGVLPNHHVRISSISSYYITVSVGVVQKDTVIQR